MDLKCLLVRSVSAGDVVFLLTAEEEVRVLSLLDERPGVSEVMASMSLEAPFDAIRDVLHGVGKLVLTNAKVESAPLTEVLFEVQLLGIEILDLESALFELDPRVSVSPSETLRAIVNAGVHQGPRLQTYVALKNLLEPTLAGILLLFLSPLLLLVALIVKLTSPGPIFYRQTREGYRGKPFDIIKFRSMRTDAEKNGPVWASASKSDARLTPIGGILRATHLDEIPQIWNVVRGEVSFIGPRPERPVFCRDLEREIPLFKLRTLVKPGITGWAQVRAGYANSVADSQRKLEFDLYYILRHSPSLDFRILLDTVGVLFAGGSEGRKRERTMVAGSPRQRLVLPGLSRRPVAGYEKRANVETS